MWPRDEVIGAEEDVHLAAFDVHGFVAQSESVEDKVEIAAVVVDFGHVDVLDGVFDGERMEVKDLCPRPV